MRLADPRETNFFTGFGDDVSEGGIFVAIYHCLPVGSELAISFVLPSGVLVEAQGRVAWVREPAALDTDIPLGMGISFIGLDGPARDAGREYMEHRERIFYDSDS